MTDEELVAKWERTIWAETFPQSWPAKVEYARELEECAQLNWGVPE
jgi:hypothetical protein